MDFFTGASKIGRLELPIEPGGSGLLRPTLGIGVHAATPLRSCPLPCDRSDGYRCGIAWPFHARPIFHFRLKQAECSVAPSSACGNRRMKQTPPPDFLLSPAYAEVNEPE